MVDPKLDKRRELAEKIVGLYKTREYRQEDIAKMLGIHVGVIQRVLQEYNYAHTKLKTKDNLCDGQKINRVVWYDKMDYLDKYI